ncbi:M13 family metallopeptidase [Sphingomonas sinipercae]|uniref:M13 family metallopeptidase n=1 Tax=Sphingomonas sinipercae TaxID=2714944 RepID=A0A6G7ZM20_9SPHN|nr:M13 family metallopeptidase [Sphingomonas sinipercae]QIL01983.1 M13 family metallopeptidase [Sphingomonas sinipercae]
MKATRLALLTASLIAIAAPAAAQTGKPAYGNWGIDSSAIDGSVKPGDDFWDYVNGAWAKRTQIAADRTFVGIDSVLNDQIDKDVRSIIEAKAQNPAASGKLGQQIGDYYATWMDTAAIESLGTAPLKPYLQRIAAVKNRTQLAELFGSNGFASPINPYIQPGNDDPTHYVVNLYQGGLSMPGRDYYLLPGAKYDAFRAAYRDYVIRMQELAGIPDAAAKADRIVALETAFAKRMWTPEQSRDAKATDNPMTVAQLKSYAPGLAWASFFKPLKLADQKRVVLNQKTAIRDEAKLVQSVPLSTWKEWLAFRFISDNATYLPAAFDEARFNFFSKTLRDVPTQRDRWKRGVEMVNGALGEGVGQIYVAEHYPPESDRQMGELIRNFRAALEEKIRTNTWMDEPTRKEALKKLASFDPRTGHPAKYIDYSSLEVRRGDLLGNALRAGEFEWGLLVERMKKPVDRSLWGMLPQTNNAYYDPSNNQITFPAAILQPPYFDPNADAASNYGSIGATIGHEIGHGFDDQGRLYDAEGRLRDWWTPASSAAYMKQANALVKQYDAYEPIPGVHIKGQLTLGENLGDLGGLEVAYAAYRKHVEKTGEPPLIDGLTGDQRFFIAYGYSWQSKAREGALRAQLLSDPHSPAKYRVNGAVRNMDAWYKAFNVKPGDRLYLPPDQRVHIWGA